MGVGDLLDASEKCSIAGPFWAANEEDGDGELSCDSLGGTASALSELEWSSRSIECASKSLADGDKDDGAANMKQKWKQMQKQAKTRGKNS